MSLTPLTDAELLTLRADRDALLALVRAFVAANTLGQHVQAEHAARLHLKQMYGHLPLPPKDHHDKEDFQQKG